MSTSTTGHTKRGHYKIEAHEKARLRDISEQFKVPLARPMFEMDVEAWLKAAPQRRALEAKEKLGSRIPSRRVK